MRPDATRRDSTGSGKGKPATRAAPAASRSPRKPAPVSVAKGPAPRTAAHPQLPSRDAAPPPASPPAGRPPLRWEEVPPGLLVKPSLRAAASTFAKVAGLLAFAFAVPVLVAFLSGDAGGVLAAFLLAEFGLLGVLPAAAGLLLPAIRLWATRYELDEDGVRVHSSIIARSDQRVPWDKVTLLVQRRTIVDRALGIEALVVVAYGAQGATLNLVGLRDAAPLRRFAALKMRESASVAGLFSND